MIFAERKNSAVINTNPSNSMRFRTKIVMTAAFSLLFGAVAANFFKISVIDYIIQYSKQIDAGIFPMFRS